MDTAQQSWPKDGPTKEEVIAQILGEPSMQFVPWEKLMGEGLVIEVHCSRIRFRKKLRYNDLGIHVPDEKTAKSMAEIFRLGMKNLLPMEYLRAMDNAEARARAILRKHSYDTIWGAFVPISNYIEWQRETDLVREEYFATMQRVLDNYAQVKAQVIKDYVRAADNAYRLLRGVNASTLTPEERDREMRYLLKAARKIKGLFPSREEIEQSFAFSTSKTYIDLPRLAGGQEESDRQAAPGAIVNKVAIEGITEEQTEKFRWARASQEQRQAMMRKMNEDVVREAKEQRSNRIDAFLTTIIGQIRWLTYSTATNVLSSIQGKQDLQPASAKSLRTLVENVRNLNFYDDQEIDRIMEMIEDLLPDKEEKKRSKVNVRQIERALAEITVVMRSSLVAINFEPRGEREENKRIADFIAPTEEEERSARESLGLPIPAWLQSSREGRGEDEGEQRVLAEATGRQAREW